MYCTNCGKEIEDDSIFCVYCGAKLNISSTSNDRTKVNNIDSQILSSKYCYFNWGAFSLNWIYPFCNRLPGWGFLIIILAFILAYFINNYIDSPVTWVLILTYVILSIIFAANANKMAWVKYPYTDGVEQFMKSQDKWNGWGIFFFILQIFSNIIWLLFIYNLFETVNYYE